MRMLDYFRKETVCSAVRILENHSVTKAEVIVYPISKQYGVKVVEVERTGGMIHHSYPIVNSFIADSTLFKPQEMEYQTAIKRATSVSRALGKVGIKNSITDLTSELEDKVEE